LRNDHAATGAIESQLDMAKAPFAPAKIPHGNVDNLDEEVLYDDVQCTSMDFDK
jgi:hypothetical protein